MGEGRQGKGKERIARDGDGKRERGGGGGGCLVWRICTAVAVCSKSFCSASVGVYDYHYLECSIHLGVPDTCYHDVPASHLPVSSVSVNIRRNAHRLPIIATLHNI